MELQTFIKDALVQIANGVTDANSHIYEQHKDGSKKIYTNSPFRLHSNLGDKAKSHSGVDFDVAVTVQSDSKMDAGAKIAVMNMLNVGGGVEESDSTNTQHRIKFSVGLHQDWD